MGVDGFWLMGLSSVWDLGVYRCMLWLPWLRVRASRFRDKGCRGLGRESALCGAGIRVAE